MKKQFMNQFSTQSKWFLVKSFKTGHLKLKISLNSLEKILTSCMIATWKYITLLNFWVQQTECLKFMASINQAARPS